MDDANDFKTERFRTARIVQIVGTIFGRPNKDAMGVGETTTA